MPISKTSSPRCRSISPARSACSSATHTTNPIPQLNVRRSSEIVESGGDREPAEDYRLPPGGHVDTRADARGQHSWNVLGEAAAGDVGHGFHRNRLQQREYAGHVDTSRLEQHLDERTSVERHVRRGFAVGQHSTYQRETVCVGAARGEAEQSIPRRHTVTVDDGVRARPHRRRIRRDRSHRPRTCRASQRFRRR